MPQSLTARLVADATRELAAVDGTEITSPDVSREDTVRMIVRLTETLRTLTNHAERLAQHTDRLAAENSHLRAEIQRMTSELHTTTTSTPLPADYTDPTHYALSLLYTAYATLALEAQAALHDEECLTSPDGIAAIQTAVADDQRANIPTHVRDSLRAHAARARDDKDPWVQARAAFDAQHAGVDATRWPAADFETYLNLHS